MSEQAKATARKFLEEQDRLRGGPADELCADGYICYVGSFPPMDVAGHKGLAAAFYSAFPDLRQEIEEVVAEGDTVVVRLRAKGTNTGSFMGNPPSGKPIDIGGFALMRVSGGKVTELREEFDQLAMMQQIGALPG